jgi:hypothetical protein
MSIEREVDLIGRKVGPSEDNRDVVEREANLVEKGGYNKERWCSRSDVH